MKRFVKPLIIGATVIVTKGLKRYLETIPEQGKCYSLKLEAWVVGCTTGSRREITGERKPGIRGDDDYGSNNRRHYTLSLPSPAIFKSWWCWHKPMFWCTFSGISNPIPVSISQCRKLLSKFALLQYELRRPSLKADTVGTSNIQYPIVF
jgi:hypothetical protein